MGRAICQGAGVQLVIGALRGDHSNQHRCMQSPNDDVNEGSAVTHPSLWFVCCQSSAVVQPLNQCRSNLQKYLDREQAGGEECAWYLGGTVYVGIIR